MRSRKFRSRRGEALRKTICLQVSSGRPRVEEDQPDLLKTIYDIALYG